MQDGPYHHEGGPLRGYTLSKGWYFIYDGEPYTSGRQGKAFPTQRRCQWAYEKHVKGVQWKIIWNQARENMPHRIGIREYVDWVAPKEPVPVPDFIKGSVNDEMRIIKGKPHKKRITKEPYKYGQSSALAYCIGWLYLDKGTGKMRANTQRTHDATVAGFCPRDVKTQYILRKLASDEGKRFAHDLLAQRGILKRYDV